MSEFVMNLIYLHYLELDAVLKFIFG